MEYQARPRQVAWAVTGMSHPQTSVLWEPLPVHCCLPSRLKAGRTKLLEVERLGDMLGGGHYSKIKVGGQLEGKTKVFYRPQLGNLASRIQYNISIVLTVYNIPITLIVCCYIHIYYMNIYYIHHFERTPWN